MRIIPFQVAAGDIVVQEKIPSLVIGRQVIATVLAGTKDGLVLVSMFGKQLLVETDLDLQKGQILNLKVSAVTPKVVMKPMESLPETRSITKLMDNLVEQLVGKFGTTPMQAFELKEILKKMVSESPDDKMTAQLAQKLIQDFSQLPANTIAYLLIPVVGDDTRGKAQVTIEKDGQDYRLHFDIQTDVLGLIESTVVRTKKGISVEISSAAPEVVDFLKVHMNELAQGLAPYGIIGIEIMKKNPVAPQHAAVDVVV
jgi:hypothetical protein